jgi:hypothetical protein
VTSTIEVRPETGTIAASGDVFSFFAEGSGEASLFGHFYNPGESIASTLTVTVSATAETLTFDVPTNPSVAVSIHHAGSWVSSLDGRDRMDLVEDIRTVLGEVLAVWESTVSERASAATRLAELRGLAAGLDASENTDADYLVERALITDGLQNAQLEVLRTLSA